MLEEQVTKNRRECRLEAVGKGNLGAKQSHSEYKFMKDIFRVRSFGDIRF